MAFWRLPPIRSLYQTTKIGEVYSLLGVSRSSPKNLTNVPRGFSWTMSSCAYNDHDGFPLSSRHRLQMAADSSNFAYSRLFSTQAKAPAQAQKMGLQVAMLSPGFVYEPYTLREKIPFWKRWFTRSGWRRTKEDIVLELKSAYAINRLRKSGYSKKKFYQEAVNLYKEISTLMANGDKTSLRKLVTENMYSALKNEIKQRESRWSSIHWELLEPVVKIRTLRARVIGVERDNLNKVFIQLTLEFLSKQKFEAYDLNGSVVAGDKDKEILFVNRFEKGACSFFISCVKCCSDATCEKLCGFALVLVRDIWVFEKSLFHPGAYWRLCGRISL